MFNNQNYLKPIALRALLALALVGNNYALLARKIEILAAISIDDAIKKQIVEIQESVRKAAEANGYKLDTSIIPANKMHITLEHVTDVEEQDLRGYVKCIEFITRKNQPFDLTPQFNKAHLEILGYGAKWAVLRFPVSKKHVLHELVKKIRNCYEDNDLKIGNFPHFKAHVSLGKFIKDETTKVPKEDNLCWAPAIRINLPAETFIADDILFEVREKIGDKSTGVSYKDISAQHFPFGDQKAKQLRQQQEAKIKQQHKEERKEQLRLQQEILLKKQEDERIRQEQETKIKQQQDALRQREEAKRANLQRQQEAARLNTQKQRDASAQKKSAQLKQETAAQRKQQKEEKLKQEKEALLLQTWGEQLKQKEQESRFKKQQPTKLEQEWEERLKQKEEELLQRKQLQQEAKLQQQQKAKIKHQEVKSIQPQKAQPKHQEIKQTKLKTPQEAARLNTQKQRDTNAQQKVAQLKQETAKLNMLKQQEANLQRKEEKQRKHQELLRSQQEAKRQKKVAKLKQEQNIPFEDEYDEPLEHQPEIVEIEL